MGAEFIGITKAQELIHRDIEQIRFATRAALIDFCFALIGRAAQYAPVDTGDLRGGFVVEINGERWMHTDSNGTVIRDRSDVPNDIDGLEIYAGTSGIVYALRQHEEMQWQHQKGGQAKYLERAFNELIGMLKHRLEAAKRGEAPSSAD